MAEFVQPGWFQIERSHGQLMYRLDLSTDGEWTYGWTKMKTAAS
jgi:hypothetical protein